jgi:hypothetical protein
VLATSVFDFSGWVIERRFADFEKKSRRKRDEKEGVVFVGNVAVLVDGVG